MTIVARHDIDGHEIAVVEQRDEDDSEFFELLVDGARIDTERFLSPPNLAALQAVVRSGSTAPTRGPSAPTIELDLSQGARREVAEGLSRLLADTYTLYLKTHNYHWNVTGPMFQTLHLMFETQYNELALAVDLIAERIRALGVRAPASYHEFAKLSSVPDDDDQPDATEMIRRLVEGQQTVVRTARSIFPMVEQAHDEPTADLLTQRMQVHEKTAWMLRSLLEQ